MFRRGSGRRPSAAGARAADGHQVVGNDAKAEPVLHAVHLCIGSGLVGDVASTSGSSVWRMAGIRAFLTREV
jgi:hypothetical protein